MSLLIVSTPVGFRANRSVTCVAEIRHTSVHIFDMITKSEIMKLLITLRAFLLIRIFCIRRHCCNELEGEEQVETINLVKEIPNKESVEDLAEK